MSSSAKALEPAFQGAGQRVGTEIWRIENFQPVPLPKADYGKFCCGDSYIILQTSSGRGGAYLYDIHFWLGKDTSQDEAVVAAIKTVELDAALGGAVHYRELQGHESDKFLSYFKPCIIPLEGGVATGFKKVEGTCDVAIVDDGKLQAETDSGEFWVYFGPISKKVATEDDIIPEKTPAKLISIIDGQVKSVDGELSKSIGDFNSSMSSPSRRSPKLLVAMASALSSPYFFENASDFGENFLKRFGYLEYDVYGDDSTVHRIQSAYESFQENFKINPTGILDDDTMIVMVKPRCGVPDIINGVNTMRPTAFKMGAPCCFVLLEGSPKWPKFALSYSFESNFPKVGKVPVELAFKQWSSATPFTFSEKFGAQPSDIIIGMYRGEHGDGYPFDGPGGVLAHAFGPMDGRLHFDGDELWSYDSHYGGGGKHDQFIIDMETVALHEIGHVLGLGHSAAMEAIMFPALLPGQIKRKLAKDDIDGINALYY